MNREALLFVGDVDAHREYWLGFSKTICTVGLRVTLPHHQVVSRWLRSLHTFMERRLSWC